MGPEICLFAGSRSVRVAERLALPTSDHGVAGSNLAGGEILPEPKRRFIAQSLSCSPFHHPEILLKGRKTLTHPSIFAGSILLFHVLCRVKALGAFTFHLCDRYPFHSSQLISSVVVSVEEFTSLPLKFEN